jgi:uncharacterized protein (DUF305 family)
MRKFISCASALALITTLSACGGTEQPANDMTAENDMNAMMADPNNPFAASEMRMHDAMMAAVGTNAADTWAKKMIEHHRGAVEMSQILLDQGITGHVADMARQAIDKQNKDIEAIQKLVTRGNPDPASAQLYAAAEKQMHDAMMAAKGADVSDTFVRKMLEHHKGAIALSDIALANGAPGAIRAQIEKTKADQQKDIEHIEGMLNGTPAAAADPEASATQTSEAAPKSTAPAKPAPAKPTAAKPKPAEPNAPAADCLPEHRAAGHC